MILINKHLNNHLRIQQKSISHPSLEGLDRLQKRQLVESSLNVYSNIPGHFKYLFKKIHWAVFGPGVLAYATRGGGRSEAGHCVKNCFPQYFGITRRYMQKKIR